MASCHPRLSRIRAARLLFCSSNNQIQSDSSWSVNQARSSSFFSSSFTMSSAITLYFCYDTSAHDCISQSKKPPKVTGVKRDRTVAKILRAFCRSSELDDGIDKLQIGRCFCQSDKNNTQRSTATFGPQDQVQKTGLGDGDRIFLRRIQNQLPTSGNGGEWARNRRR